MTYPAKMHKPPICRMELQARFLAPRPPPLLPWRTIARVQLYEIGVRFLGPNNSNNSRQINFRSTGRAAGSRLEMAGQVLRVKGLQGVDDAATTT